MSQPPQKVSLRKNGKAWSFKSKSFLQGIISEATENFTYYFVEVVDVLTLVNHEMKFDFSP